jgi:hypothetical protein
MKKIFLILTLCICLNVYAQLPTYVPTNGLMGWWSLNGNANDASANNNHGTNNGAVDTTDRYGNPNSAYFFNGSSSYISIPTSASLESPTTNLTMSAWVKLSGYSLVGQSFGPILTKSNNSANAFMYRFTIDMNGISYYAGTNNWTTNTGAAFNFSLNQWYLLTAVLDSFNSYFYLNDSLIAANAFTTNIANNTLPLEIGRDVPGITEVFNGIIDDIGIWNVALTQQQITDLFLGPTAGVNESVSENSLHVFPNPSGDMVTIRMPELKAGNAELFLYDAKGSMVKKLFTDVSAGNSELKFSIADLPPGMYSVRIVNGNRQQVTRFIKQ